MVLLFIGSIIQIRESKSNQICDPYGTIESTELNKKWFPYKISHDDQNKNALPSFYTYGHQTTDKCY